MKSRLAYFPRKVSLKTRKSFQLKNDQIRTADLEKIMFFSHFLQQYFTHLSAFRCMKNFSFIPIIEDTFPIFIRSLASRFHHLLCHHTIYSLS
jgi:hypothetical protein